ncbi:hypothetical protein LJR066_002820 [Acidovorax sp. LjRoot66]|uniref:hypothetical protein n=1 Tax=Acidovorax sp. LjRoot66 TaxID=3342334 RepID=UPI003ED03C5E
MTDNTTAALQQGTEAADPQTLVSEDPEWGTAGHAEAFMLGNLMRVCKRRFANLVEPFNKLSEQEQGRLLSGLHDDLKEEIKTAVRIISANGRVTFRAEVDSVQFKGPSDIKATLKLVSGPETHALADMAGGFVTVVIESLDELLAIPDAELAGEPDTRPLFDASTED